MTPARGFERSEYEGRVARAQARMAQAGIEALLLTTEPEVRYFTVYLTRFWESPTRPWFLIVPASGAPVAVIPTIGASLMARAGVRDIRTWSAPDLADEITAAVKCPTIGIGASSRCDGQILVTNDLLGMTDWVPKFVKKNADLKSVIEDAAATYAEEVKSRAFPGEAQTYKLRKTT